MTIAPLTKEQITQIAHDQELRKRLASEKIAYFFAIYLSHHFDVPLAPFHYEFFRIAENDKIPLSLILAFRGSGKSTIFTLCYVLWSIIGIQKKRFVLILTKNQTQARQYMKTMIQEFEDNGVLKADVGPFTEDGSEMSAYNIYLKEYDARIMVASVEQNIRGLKHGSVRPEVIILDDVEDLEGMRTAEGREKLFDWYTRDIYPIGAANKRFIIVGTQLHPDDLIGRLATRILEKRQKGVVRKYPIISQTGKIAWKGRYPNKQAIETEKENIVSDRAWQSEYMLNPQAAIEAIIKPEWIHRYDKLLPNTCLRETGVGIDVAISKKAGSDFTAMVTAKAYKMDGKSYIFIQPKPINAKYDFPEILDQIKLLYTSLSGGISSTFYFEANGFQPAVTQELMQQGIMLEDVKVTVGKDKRLEAVSSWMRDGKILFPVEGCEELIKQILYFGTHGHDDIMDAFTLVCIKLMEKLNEPEPGIRWLDGDPFGYTSSYRPLSRF